MLLVFHHEPFLLQDYSFHHAAPLKFPQGQLSHRPGPGEGVVQAFRRPEATNENLTVKLRGLDPQRPLEYCSTCHRTEISGRDDARSELIPLEAEP